MILKGTTAMPDAEVRPIDTVESIAGAEESINQLSKRLLFIFVLPLVVIVALGVYTFYLSWRIGKVETHAKILAVLEEVNVVERLHASQKNYAWTISQYEKLAKQDPNARILTRLAGLYLSVGNFEKGIATLQQAKRVDPTYWEAESVLMFAYLEQGKEKEALQAGEAALALNSLDARTLNNVAWLYATAKEKSLWDLNKALEYASKAVEYTRGRHSNYLDTLAEIQLRRGEANLALETIEKAIKVERGQLAYLEEQRKKFGHAAGRN